jgi:Prenyltransferase and squalene oxidase repeat
MKITAVLVAAIALALTPAAAHAADATHYLLSRQTASGGFAEAGTGSASGALTEWTVMGLRAAGVRAGSVHRAGGATPTAYLAGHAGGWRNAYQLERGILAVVAVGRNPAAFAGRNLVAALRARIGSRGRIGSAANSTYWGVLALRAARSAVPASTLRYIRAAQSSNGGFGWSPAAAPDSNDTAAALLALHAAGGRCRSRTMSHGLGYLASTQARSHGYALEPGGSADSQSTSWAIQARHACGLRNRRSRAWLLARELPSGAFNYQPGTTTTPAWVTAQVMPAVHGRWYPIR